MAHIQLKTGLGKRVLSIGPPFNIDVTPNSVVNVDTTHPVIQAVIGQLNVLDAVAPPVAGDTDSDGVADTGLTIRTDVNGIYVNI